VPSAPPDDGNTLAVGADLEDAAAASNAGAVYLY
jgi:hypothetical protein